MKHLIVFTHGGGQLANQLTNYAHLVAFVEEYSADFECIDAAFWNYTPLFEGTAKNRFCQYPEINAKINFLAPYYNLATSKNKLVRNYISIQYLRFLHLLGALHTNSQSIKVKKGRYDVRKGIAGTNVPDFNFDEPQYIEKLKAKPLTFLSGWAIRSWKLFEKHQQKIRAMFQVSNPHRERAAEFIDTLRKNHDFIVGVSIRHGDYRIWNEGKFFFDTEIYVDWIRQVQSLYSDKNIAFVIASNEKQNPELFKDLPVYYATGNIFGTGHYMEDFAESSLCDLILTPPSTFSVWAAFVGNVPILPLYQKDQILRPAEILHRNIFDAIEHFAMKQAIK